MKLQRSLPQYTGELQQVPPQHSAVQIDGRRLYELARSGIAVDPPPRHVVIHHIDIVDYQAPVLTVCVDCGAGTYIRSLARDIGRDTGCGAYLSDLVRLRSGAFDLDDAWTLDELAHAPIANRVADHRLSSRQDIGSFASRDPRCVRVRAVDERSAESRAAGGAGWTRTRLHGHR